MKRIVKSTDSSLSEAQLRPEVAFEMRLASMTSQAKEKANSKLIEQHL